MKEQDELAGIIEEEVKKSNLVDPGLVELGLIKKNAPIYDRREFLAHSAKNVGQFLAMLAGLGYLTQSTTSCAPIGGSIRMHADKDWELYLRKQDLIRGPPLLIHPSTGLPSDFQHHQGQWINRGWGAVDYNVPIGTPIVPTANARSLLVDIAEGFNQVLFLIHPNRYNSQYGHLDGYTEIINQGKEVTRTSPATGRTYLFKDQNINKSIIIGFSGNRGIGPALRSLDPQLHFEIRRYAEEILSLNSFELGIDAEKPLDEYLSSTGKKRAARPVYWDGKTAIYRAPQDRSRGLQQTLDTLDKRVKESNLDSETKDELLKRHNNPLELRDYLGMRVLQKKQDKERNLVYEFRPGSLMYALMLEFYTRTSKQEFIAMLPFIYPELKHIYQKANPNVKL